MYYEEILKDLNERIKKSEPFSKEHTLLQKLYFTYKQFKSEAVEEVDKWISVEDRLPESGESVLCYRSLGPLSRMVENSWELHTEQNEAWFKHNFSHWREKPSAPKQDKQK